MLVTFGDINDPKSVERIDPAAIGVRRIIVEVTDEPVTTGIEKRLGWLGSHRGSLDYSGRLHPNSPEKDLTPSAFWGESNSESRSLPGHFGDGLI